MALGAADPVLGMAVASAERKDDVKLSSALQKALEEDPSLRVTHVQDTGETVLEGQGEMHLRVAMERLTGKYGVAVKTHEPHVPYKETIRGAVSVRGRHKKQSGGHGQFGDVVLDIKPLPRGSGFVFDETITGGAVPRNYFSSIEEGVAEYLHKGPLGFPVVDLGGDADRRLVPFGRLRPTWRSAPPPRSACARACRSAGRCCSSRCSRSRSPCRRRRRRGSTPSSRSGAASSSASTRGPGWQGWDVVEAMIPQAEIRDLIVELRSATAGVGTFKAHFDHLAELTGKLADQAIERASAKAA